MFHCLKYNTVQNRYLLAEWSARRKSGWSDLIFRQVAYTCIGCQLQKRQAGKSIGKQGDTCFDGHLAWGNITVARKGQQYCVGLLGETKQLPSFSVSRLKISARLEFSSSSTDQQERTAQERQNGGESESVRETDQLHVKMCYLLKQLFNYNIKYC